MAIYHDAYLFSADDFAKFLKKHDTEPKQLGAIALQYHQDQFVQELCDRYGSWDYQGVETYLNEYKGNKPE